MFDLFFGENGVGYVYLYSAPIYIVLILIEMAVSYYHKRKQYQTMDTLTNIYMATLNYGLDLIMKAFAMAVMFFFFHHKIIEWNYNDWYYWVLVFVLQDFAYYVHHCVDHFSRFFWAVHATHHNSEFFNITTGFRSPVFQPLYRYLFFSPLAFLGFNPWHIMGAYAIFQVYGTIIHTQNIKSMGFLDWILVTPAHHRVHHASNHRYLDKNMGMALIIWDRIFGTFEKEDPDAYEPTKFGLTIPIEDKGPVNIIFHEWKAILKDVRQPGISFVDKLKYIFYLPGWNHKGNFKTSKTLREEETKKERIV